MDELAAAVKEGVELVQWCRNKLRTTQKEVETALTAMENAPEEVPNDDPRPARKHVGERAASTQAAGLFDAEDMGEEGLEPPAYSV